MKPRWMWLFYVVWVVMCLLSSITSTVLGFVVVCLGMIIRLLELNLTARQNLIAEVRKLGRDIRIERELIQERYDQLITLIPKEADESIHGH